MAVSGGETYKLNYTSDIKLLFNTVQLNLPVLSLSVFCQYGRPYLDIKVVKCCSKGCAGRKAG